MSEPTARLGRPRTRPPVRRVTLELDAEQLQRVEQVAASRQMSLRAAVEEGLYLYIEHWFVERIKSRE